MGKRLWKKRKEDPGCIWTVFRMLDYHPWHHHANKFKLLPYDEHKPDTNSITSTKTTNEMLEFRDAPVREDDDVSINSVSVNSTSSKSGSRKRKSIKARIKTLIKAYQGSKSSKVKSIQEHELLALREECNDFNSPTLISLLKATPKLIRAASRREKSPSDSHEGSVKNKEAKDDFVGVLELFRVDKGLFLKIVEDSPPRKPKLVKSGSFPFSNVAHKATNFGSTPSKVEDKHNEAWPMMNQGPDVWKSKSQRVVRSSSLKDSLDRYGRFFDTTTTTTNRGFKKHLSKSLKLTNEKDFMLLSDQQGRSSFRERLHLPENESETPRASLENLLQNLSQSEARVVRLDSPKEVNGPKYIQSPDLYMEMKGSNFGVECNEQEQGVEQVEIVEVPNDSNWETFETVSSVSGLDMHIQIDETDKADLPISEGSAMSRSTSTLFEITEDVQEFPAHSVAPENNEIDSYNEDLLYVKYVLDIIGFTTTDNLLEAWQEPDQPLDPALFDGIEICCPFEPKTSTPTKATICSTRRRVLFDMINEALLDVHDKSYAYYPKALSSTCHVHLVLKGRNRVVEEVWEFVKQYLNWEPELDADLNFAVAHDLSRHQTGWSNLQTDTELLAIDLEDWIFSELLDEIVCY